MRSAILAAVTVLFCAACAETRELRTWSVPAREVKVRSIPGGGEYSLEFSRTAEIRVPLFFSGRDYPLSLDSSALQKVIASPPHQYEAEKPHALWTAYELCAEPKFFQTGYPAKTKWLITAVLAGVIFLLRKPGPSRFRYARYAVLLLLGVLLYSLPGAPKNLYVKEANGLVSRMTAGNSDAEIVLTRNGRSTGIDSAEMPGDVYEAEAPPWLSLQPEAECLRVDSWLQEAFLLVSKKGD